MSELDLAKKLFGTSNRNTGYSSAPSRIQNQGVTTTVGTSSTRYGTVQAIGDNNYLTILLDGSDEPIKAYCETPVVVGQRVSVVIGNNTITVIALQSFVEQVQQNQEQTNTKFQEIQQQGEELAASVAEDIQQVQDSVDAATSAANSAKESAEAASEAASAASDKADAASEKADELSSSLGELSGKVDSVETTVNGVESDVSELTTTVTATQETAQSALTAATSAQQDITGFKTTVSQTYETKADADAAMAQEVLDRNSAISQSATEIKQEVSQNYVSNETGETLATKAEVTQSANQIKQEVSQNYQVKGDYATSGELDDAIAKEVSDRNSAITQSATEIKQEVSENYVNNETGATLATKTELTTAIDGVNSTVSKNYLNKNDASKTYATKTEVTQSADSIKQEVSETYQVKGDYATDSDISSAIAQEVLDRNSAIEQSATQINQSVSQNYQSKTDAGTMQSNLQAQIKTQADRITQEVSDRKTAVTGAVTESKTYTDTTAEGLKTTISESVMNEVGETYTKQADFSATVDGLTATFTQSIGEVEDKAEAAQTTADNASKTATAAQSTANTAKTTADTANTNATTAKNNASTALDTANTAKSTADKVNQTVSTIITSDANGVTVGRSDLDTKARVSSTAEFQILDNSNNKLASFGKDEQHLGMGSDEATIYLLNDKFQMSAVEADIGVRDGYYDLIVHPTDMNHSSMDGHNLYLKLTDNCYMGVQNSVPGIGAQRHYARVKGDWGTDIYSNNQIAISSGGGTTMRGDTLSIYTNTITKPAITIGARDLGQQIQSTNNTFTRNVTYGVGQLQRNQTAGTTMWVDGNYIYVSVFNRAGGGTINDAYTYPYVPVEISSQARIDGIMDTNFATEVRMEHVSGNAKTPLPYESLGGTLDRADGFGQSVLIPHIIQLYRTLSNEPDANTYDVYRFSLEGRTTNASGIINSWSLTVKML